MEEWRDIRGYEGRYQISSYGNIKSLVKPTEHILVLSNSKGWYITTTLVNKSGKHKTHRIHRLVAENFIGKIPKGYQVHHIDGNKQNNRVENLEIISTKEHSKKTILNDDSFLKGMNNYNRYVKPKRIRQYTSDGYFIAEFANSMIASKYTGVCQRNILQVCDKTPFGNKGGIRKQAGGYVWEYADTEGK